MKFGFVDMRFDNIKNKLIERLTTLGRSQKFAILLCIDAILVPVSFALALVFFEGHFTDLAGVAPVRFAAMIAIVTLCAFIVSPLLGLPRIKLNTYEETGILRTAVFAAAMGCVAYIGGKVLFPQIVLTQDVMSMTMLLLIFSVGSRIGMRSILERLYRSGQPRQRVLIYGAGRTGVQLASALRTDESVVPFGFLDDNPTIQKISVAGLSVYSPVGLEDLLVEHDIKRVVLAMPSLSRSKVARISRRIERTGREVSLLPSFSTLIGQGEIVDAMQPVRASDYLNRANLECELDGLCDVYTDRSVMITGAGGSIGSELCRQVLSCKPKRLVLFEINEYALYQLVRELEEICHDTSTDLVPILGSVTDAPLVASTMTKHAVDVVLHSAAYKHVKIVEENVVVGMHNNAIGTKTVADAAIAAGVSLFVQISTDKAVRPTSMMGASKRLAEMVIQDLATRSDTTRFSIVRFGNVLGSSGSVVPLFEEQIARGGPVTLTHPDVTRYFMTINEAVRLVLFAGKETVGGELFVLDMGEPVSIRKLARQMIERAGYSVRSSSNPDGDIEIAIVGLKRGEKLHEELNDPNGSLRPTNHAKIMSASDKGLSQIEVAAAMRALKVAVDDGSAGAVRDVVARFIGQYRYDPLSGGLLHSAD